MAILSDTVQSSMLVQSYMPAVGTFAEADDNALIPAPAAGQRLVIKELVIQNESTAITVLILKDATQSYYRARLKENDCWTFSAGFGDEWRLSPGEPLIANLDGANSHSFSARYFIEPA